MLSLIKPAPIVGKNAPIDTFVTNLGAAMLAVEVVVLPLAHVNAIRSLGFVLTLVCTGFLLFRNSRGDWKHPPLLWVFALWIASALLSFSSSTILHPQLTPIWDESIKSALYFYGAYYIAARLGQRGTSVWFFSAAISITILACASILSWLHHGRWTPENIVPALGDYDTSALTLFPLVCIPIFRQSRILVHAKCVVPLLFFSVVTAIVAATLSLSRSFWLVGAVMLICSTLTWNWKSDRRWNQTIPLLGTGLVFFAISAWLVARSRGFDSVLFFDTRSVIYGPVLEHLKEAPLTGFGYGHLSQKDWYLAHMRETGVEHAHNIVLSYIEQMGLPGLITIFGIFGGCALRFFRNISRNDSYRTSLACLGLALVVGIFVKNNLDIFFVRHNLLLFFVCCGLLLGAAESPTRERPTMSPRLV